MAEHPNPYGTPTGDFGDDLGGCRGAFHALLFMLALALAVFAARSC